LIGNNAEASKVNRNTLFNFPTTVDFPSQFTALSILFRGAGILMWRNPPGESKRANAGSCLWQPVHSPEVSAIVPGWRRSGLFRVTWMPPKRGCTRVVPWKRQRSI